MSQSALARAVNRPVPSATPVSLIDELNDAVAVGDVQRRLRIMVRISDLFAVGSRSYSGEQIAMFDDVLQELAIDIEADPDAAEKGLKAGDVILEDSGETVKTPDDVVSGVKKAQNLKRTAVLLHVKSSDQKRFVAVQLSSKKG